MLSVSRRRIQSRECVTTWVITSTALLIIAEINIFSPDKRSASLSASIADHRVKARFVVSIAGQLAGRPRRHVVGADDFDAHCVQLCANIETALEIRRSRDLVQRDPSSPTYRLHSQLSRESGDLIANAKFPRLFPDGGYPPKYP